MNVHFWEILVSIISIIGSLSSVVSLLVSFREAKQQEKLLLENKVPNNSHREKPINQSLSSKSSKQKYSKKEKNRWPIRIILFVVVASLCLLIYCYIFDVFHSWVFLWSLISFLISFVSLVIYAIKAYRSFDKRYILPPEQLWQVLFNKIPSYVENGNGLVFRFLVLKMERSKKVEETGKTIKESYSGRKNFVVDVKTSEGFENDKKLITGDLSGVVFIVGDQCFDRQEEILRIMDEFSKQLALPLAYILVGKNHYRFSKYHRISDKYKENFANHLIMRSYLRSERWTRLSRASHIGFLVLLVLSGLFLFSSVLTIKTVVEQQEKIKAKNNALTHDSIIMLEFGIDRSAIYLPNKDKTRLLKDNIDIETLQQDESFRSFNEGFAKYIFEEVDPKQILLWLRNNESDSLKCVYDGSSNPNHNSPKGHASMIGGIADNEIFVLWPSCLDTDTLIWKNNMAWSNDDNGGYAISKLKQNNNKNIALVLKQTVESEEITLFWAKSDNKQKTINENSLVLYGFSYDGRLAIELDFDYEDLKTRPKVYPYMQGLVFRNCIRKYSACITSYLNSHANTISQTEDSDHQTLSISK